MSIRFLRPSLNKLRFADIPIDAELCCAFKANVLEQLDVSLGERSYPIFLGEDLRSEVAGLAKKWRQEGRRTTLVVDSSVAGLHERWIDSAFAGIPKFTIAGGEGSKSLQSLGSVLDFLADQKLDRGSVVVAMGGGVVGDLAGFAASIYLRGLDVVQIPTTLLAMVDSAVGGKTGINLAAGKNLVGTFHQPKAVYVNTDFLGTLPAREFAAGVAEIIKCGLLGDPRLFEQLSGNPLLPPGDPRISAIIRRCCELKAAIVQADERETERDGGRALLNLGHTFGHALEQATGYGLYLHGEAVAIGVVCAARYSEQAGILTKGGAARVEAVVAAAGLPVRIEPPIEASRLVAAMRQDKKAKGGRIRLIVLRNLGEAAVLDESDEDLILSIWRAAGAA